MSYCGVMSLREDWPYNMVISREGWSDVGVISWTDDWSDV